MSSNMVISRPLSGPPLELPNRPPRREFSRAKGHILAASGEFLGVFLWLLLAYAGNIVGATQAATGFANGTKSSETILFISLSYSFPLLVNIWVMFHISGAHFNPAVTLGVCLSGGCEWVRGAIMVSAQLLGSIAAGVVVKALFPGNIALANSNLGTGATITQGFFMEVFFTLQLVLVVLTLSGEKSAGIVVVPVGVGLTVFVLNLAGGSFTSGSANPARSLGCAVASLAFPNYHWIYWLGPGLGAVMAAGLHMGTKHLKDIKTDNEVPKEAVEMRSW